MGAGRPAAAIPPATPADIDPSAVRRIGPPATDPAPTPSLGREVAAVFVLFTLLGLVYTWPLAVRFSTGIPYVRFPAHGGEVNWMQPGDSLQLYYWFWLMGDNLT